MTTDKSRVETIFFAAIEVHSPDELAAYLNEACGDDASLRHRPNLDFNYAPRHRLLQSSVVTFGVVARTV